MNNILDSKFIKMLYEYYKNTDPNKKTPFTEQVKSNLSKEQLDILEEYNILFKSLYLSPILKNLGIEFNDLNLSNIIKGERPDFRLNHNGNIIGIEIKDFRMHDNIANRIRQKIKAGISYDDLKTFIEKEDKENFIKYIKCIETDKNNKPILNTNLLNLNNSVEECIKFIDKKIKNAMTYSKIDNLFIAITFRNEIYALNMLDDLVLDKRISKYEKYYANSAHGKLILKLY